MKITKCLECITEVNHSEMAICVTSVRSVGVFDRSPSNGRRIRNLGRKPYWYCNRVRDSRHRNNKYIPKISTHPELECR